jgi:hypothetical protein
MMDLGKISKADFDDKLDWIYWELWHHEGRRVGMSRDDGADYLVAWPVQWPNTSMGPSCLKWSGSWARTRPLPTDLFRMQHKCKGDE